MKLCGGELLCFDLKEMSEGQSRWLLPELFCVFWIADDDDIVSIFFLGRGTCNKRSNGAVLDTKKGEVGNVTIECMSYIERKK